MTEQAKTITVTCPKCGEEIDVTDIERKIQGKKRIEETEQHIERLKTEIELIEKKIKANKNILLLFNRQLIPFPQRRIILRGQQIFVPNGSI